MGDTRELLLLGDALEEMAKLPAGVVAMLLVDLPTAGKWVSVLPFEKLWPAWRRVCKPGAPVVLFTKQPFTTVAAASNLGQLRTEWHWQKSNANGVLTAQQNALVFCELPSDSRPGMRIQPARDLVELCEVLIEKYTAPEQIVLDCCMGTGAVGVAAKRTGRRFVGIDCDASSMATAQERIDSALQVDLAASIEEQRRESIYLYAVPFNLFARR